jgi:tetratricopeptide (TPR) repeat protein
MAKEKDEFEEEFEEFFALEDEEEEDSLEEDEKDGLKESSNLNSPNKTLYIAVAILTALAFGVISTLIYIYFNKSKKDKEIEDELNATKIVQKIKKSEDRDIEYESYEKVMQKAKELYKKGEREKSLSLQKELSIYNQALSNYNIGVAKLKEGRYDEAIERFKLSMAIEKLEFESALNMAVAYYKKGDEELFKKYLSYASKIVSAKASSPLFDYYKTLVNYYSGEFIEATVALRNRTSPFYKDSKDTLLAKIYTFIGDIKDAASILEAREDDLFALGLLYALNGEFELSKKYLEKIAKNTKEIKPKVALSLVYNRLGLLKSSADMLNKSYKSDKNSTRIFPIKVDLKGSLFDPVIAQKEFQKRLFFNERNRFSLLFHFAPFELMSPKNSVKGIDMGAEYIYIDQLSPAIKSLKLSSDISKSNLHISNGIEAAFKKDLYKAKEIFSEGIKLYPDSSKLHYNLALTYAKLGNFKNASKEFKKSFILDNNNYQALIFEQFCNKLTSKLTDSETLKSLEEEILKDENPSFEKRRALYLISIAKDTPIQKSFELSDSLFDNAIELVLSQMAGDKSHYESLTKKILQKLPNDPVANILEIEAKNGQKDIKEFAREIQDRFMQKSIDFNSLYRGELFERELSVNIFQIAGIVHKLKERVINDKATYGDSVAYLQLIAYIDIYLKNFNSSYKIYNNLIDNRNIRDSNTLFFASVSAIGASHHANAIALLELSKLTDSSNFESRYALGLLYQEAKNFEGASIEFQKIGDIRFDSNYFTFSLR